MAKNRSHISLEALKEIREKKFSEVVDLDLLTAVLDLEQEHQFATDSAQLVQDLDKLIENFIDSEIVGDSLDGGSDEVS
jgi:hypothetical protein